VGFTRYDCVADVDGGEHSRLEIKERGSQTVKEPRLVSLLPIEVGVRNPIVAKITSNFGRERLVYLVMAGGTVIEEEEWRIVGEGDFVVDCEKYAEEEEKWRIVVKGDFVEDGVRSDLVVSKQVRICCWLRTQDCRNIITD